MVALEDDDEVGTVKMMGEEDGGLAALRVGEEEWGWRFCRGGEGGE